MESTVLSSAGFDHPFALKAKACGELAPSSQRGKRCGDSRPAVREDAAEVALRYKRSERTALYIETQEGDVVRLRISVRDSLRADGRMSEDNGATVTELTVAARSSVKIRFSVEGELSADELAAIRSVVDQAGTLAAEFFAGDAPQAFATAAALDFDGAQLARVGLRLSAHERFAYSAKGAYVPPPALAAPTAPPTAASAEEPQPAAGPPPAETPPAETPAAETPAAETPPAATPPAVTPPDGASYALAAIGEFLAALLDSLAAPPAEADGSTAASSALSLKLRVFQSVTLTLAATELAPAQPEQSSGVSLLADTLDALAARDTVSTRA